MGLPYPTYEPQRYLTERFGLRWDEQMQDWPLEAVDGEHLAAFCDAYESGMPDADTQSALMHCILCALDDAMRSEGVPSVATELQADRIAGWLRNDFDRYAKIIEHWHCGVDRSPDHGFAITPLMRRVWNDFYAPPYGVWQEREAKRNATIVDNVADVKSYWNHRVMRHAETSGYTGETVIWYAIHEVFYDSDGATTWTQDPVPAIGDDTNDLAKYLAEMAQALKYPVLEYITGNEIEESTASGVDGTPADSVR